MAQNDPISAVQHWRGHIDLQMHFNSMLMQLRAIGMSVVVAVFGAAALTLARSPDRMTVVPGGQIHVAAIVMAAGLLLLATIFVLDYFYYYRALLAVVEQTEALETKSQQPESPIAFNLTRSISGSLSRTRATVVLGFFYGIPLVSGLLFLFYLATL